jgi:hypothetical protein
MVGQLTFNDEFWNCKQRFVPHLLVILALDSAGVALDFCLRNCLSACFACAIVSHLARLKRRSRGASLGTQSINGGRSFHIDASMCRIPVRRTSEHRFYSRLWARQRWKPPPPGSCILNLAGVYVRLAEAAHQLDFVLLLKGLYLIYLSAVILEQWGTR